MRAKPLLTVAGLVLLVFATDRLGSLALDKLMLRSDYRLSRLYAGKIDADVVAFGSSRAIHMLDPAKLSALSGAKVYDVGLNRIDMGTERIFVEDYLAHNPKPKLVLLEVSNLNWAESAAGEYSAYADQSPALGAKLDSEQKGWFPWRHIFHSHTYNGDLIWRVMIGLKGHGDQEGSPLNQAITPSVIEAFRKRHWVFDAQPDKMATLQQTVRAIEAKGVRVELVLAPFHSSVLGDWRPKYVADLQKAFPGREIHDYSTGVADVGFSDPLHLNALGRESFAPDLAGLIKSDLQR
jgi:hypothetical protein